MNKVLKGLVAVAATAAMAVAGFAGASTAMAAEGDVTITIGSETTPLATSVLVMYTLAIVCLTKLKPLLVRRPMLHTRSVLAGLTMIRLPTQLRLLTAVLP